MKVSEIFLSIDGEGKRAGLPVVFIRFFGCNLRCSYCDSLYAIDDKVGNYQEMTIDEIMTNVQSFGVKAVTVTGGEPLCQDHINDFLYTLSNLGYDVNVETNGSINIEPYKYHNVWFTVDYKCPSSKMEEQMKTYQFINLTSKDVIKFVVGSQKDLSTAYELSKHFHSRTKAQIYWSPVFDTISYDEIVNYILEHKLYYVKFQLQLHKFIWDPEMKGV